MSSGGIILLVAITMVTGAAGSECDKLDTESVCMNLWSLQKQFCSCLYEDPVAPTPDEGLTDLYLADAAVDNLCPNGVCGNRTQPCPIGWRQYQSSCYMIGHKEVTWYRAQRKCQRRGGYLAEINDDNENNFIGSFARQELRTFGGHDGDTMWLGASDNEQEGMWRWMTSRIQVRYINWKTGEPNSFQGKNEDCMVMYVMDDGFTWNDVTCKYSRRFVCEMN